MIIAAYAIGAQEGYAYIRAEYPIAVEMFNKAIESAKEYGLLGDNDNSVPISHLTYT